MVTKIIQQGGEHFIPIDSHTMERWGIDTATPLEMRCEAGRLIVTAVNGHVRRQELDQILAEIDAEYGDVLKRLAE